MDNILEIKNYRKRYNKNKNYAVDDVSFQVKENEIVGLLGHNGAGKTTLIKSIVGLLSFNEGSISISSFDVLKDSINAKKLVGYVDDSHITLEKMSGYEYLSFIANIYKVKKEDFNSRLKELDEYFSLGKDIYKIIESYSHGMKQKIAIMASLIHYPKLWILDEPTSGLDPSIVESLLEYMFKFKKDNGSILFSSHNLNYVIKVCDRIIVLNNGKIVKESDSKEDFKYEELEQFFKKE